MDKQNSTYFRDQDLSGALKCLERVPIFSSEHREDFNRTLMLTMILCSRHQLTENRNGKMALSQALWSPSLADLIRLLGDAGCSRANIVDSIESLIEEEVPSKLQLRALASLGQAVTSSEPKTSEPISFSESVLFLVKTTAVMKGSDKAAYELFATKACETLGVSNPEEHFCCEELGMPDFWAESEA